jgi:HNH endonuclease
MSIYSNQNAQRKKRTTVNYRRIYQKHHGVIPVDEFGRSFEIHHIDGNNHNNDPTNLVALSIQDHYNLHLNKKDYGEAWAIGARMKIDPKELSRLSSLNNQKTMQDGTNPFSDPNIQQQGTKAAWVVHQESIANGTFHLQSGKIQSKAQQKLVKKNKHIFQNAMSNEERLKAGTHPSQIKVTCPKCCKVGSKPGMMTKHFDNCTFEL